MSIGYRTVKYDYDTAKEIRTINELRLYEVSLVTRAANEEATIKSEDVRKRQHRREILKSNKQLCR